MPNYFIIYGIKRRVNAKGPQVFRRMTVKSLTYLELRESSGLICSNLCNRSANSGSRSYQK